LSLTSHELEFWSRRCSSSKRIFLQYSIT
jgi:hypothetical protein